MPRAMLIGALFFVSGFTGLVYEVVWAKYLALLLGSTAYAQVGVLAVFMGGLALGSATWGRRADRSARPLRLYGWLEIGVGLSAALFAVGFDPLSRLYWSALAATGNVGVAAAVVRALLCAASMIVPTVCMGGTLPVLSRALALQRSAVGRGVAYLYAVNSFGAVTGSVLTGFVLVPSWGLDVPLIVAALINLLIGAVATVLDRSSAVETLHAPEGGMTGAKAVTSSEADDIRGYRVLVPLCAAVSGAVAMIYEVAWIRLCSLVLGSSTYSFCIMLTAFIAGIAAGGLVYTLSYPARGRPLRFFALTSLASVLLLLVCLPFYDRLPFLAARLTWTLRQHQVSFGLYQTAMLGLCVVVMLPLTFISGLNFPALAQAAAAAHAGVGRPVSYVLFANTTGTIAGTVATGLYLLPAIGLQSTFQLGCVVSLSAVLLVMFCDPSVARRSVASAVLAMAALALLYVRFVPKWDLRLLTAGEFRQHEGLEPRSFTQYVAEIDQQVVYYRDGASATVSVERRRDDLVLRINGKADASAQGDRDTQLVFGHLPAVLHPAARRALVIGYGSGMTTGALLRHPLESVDVVEISPEVMAADTLFRPFTGNPLADRRTDVFVEDARTFLYRTPRKYDLIVSEPSNPWLAGIANLFTAEFFEQAKAHLNDDGLLVQWFHTYESSNIVAALILRTVTASFAEVHVFQPNVWDVIVIASPSSLRTDRQAMQQAFDAASDLPEIGIKSLTTLLATEVLSPKLARTVANGGARNGDRLPLLEYAAPRAFFDGRTANLIANVSAVGVGDFLQAPSDLDADQLHEAVDYLASADMLSFNGSLRFLGEWLRRDPAAPPLHAAIARWSTDRPLSAQLMPALMENPPVDAPARSEYLNGLLAVLANLVPRPTVEQIRSVEPLARAAADAGTSEPLERIGVLYLNAAGYAEALSVFNELDSERRALIPEQHMRLQCGRGEALQGLGRKAEAVAAFRACAVTDDTNLRTRAEEGIRRASER
ncbi:MAG: fused MFS/spermidine synthase [Deltaproteobacteria bacterium]|nr:fused MFS/spermidine synthase [Deltaproteobacteria bacterium]